MSYKIAVSFDVATREDRDAALRGLRHMLLGLGLGVEGRITVKHEREFRGGDYLSLFGFGVEEREPTPIEQAIADAETAPVTIEEARESEEAATVDEDEAPAAPPADDEEPRTPFDRLLGRDEGDADGND